MNWRKILMILVAVIIAVISFRVKEWYIQVIILINSMLLIRLALRGVFQSEPIKKV